MCSIPTPAAKVAHSGGKQPQEKARSRSLFRPQHVDSSTKVDLYEDLYRSAYQRGQLILSCFSSIYSQTFLSRSR